VAAVIPAVAAAAAIPVEVEAVTPGVAAVAAAIPAAAAAAAAAAIPAVEAEYRRAMARHLLRATGHRPAAVGVVVSAGVVLAAGHRLPAMELHLAPPLAVTGHPRVRLPPTGRLPAVVAVSAAGAVSAAVNHRRLMVHPRVEAADPRQRTVHLPVVEVSEAASEVERLRRAMEPLPRVIVHPLRAMGHRAAVVEVEVEADRRAATERLALADIPVVVVEVSAEVDTLADQCPPRTAHHRQVAAVDTQAAAAAGIQVAAAAAILAAVAVDIPAEAAAVDIPAAAAVDIPAEVEADILAVVVADTPVAAAAAGKIKLIPII